MGINIVENYLYIPLNRGFLIKFAREYNKYGF